MAYNTEINAKKSGLPRWVMVLLMLVFVFFAWFFFKILVYILVSAVLSIIGQPLVDFFPIAEVEKNKLPQRTGGFYYADIYVRYNRRFF